MCEMAPISEGARPFPKVLAELRLEVSAPASGGRQRASPRLTCPAAGTNADDKLPHHRTRLLDLLERALELDVFEIGIRFVVSNR